MECLVDSRSMGTTNSTSLPIDTEIVPAVPTKSISQPRRITVPDFTNTIAKRLKDTIRTS